MKTITGSSKHLWGLRDEQAVGGPEFFLERIRAFREKWGDPDEDDDWTEERLEQAEQELPFGRHFEMELEADGHAFCNRKRPR